MSWPPFRRGDAALAPEIGVSWRIVNASQRKRSIAQTHRRATAHRHASTL
jgi:hypothetical protein